VPPVKTRAERILAIVREQLASIQADATNARGYTFAISPDVVLRVDSLTEKLISSGHKTVYAIRADFVETTPATYEASDNVVHADLVLMTQYRPFATKGDVEDPFATQDDLRDTRRSDMAGDVRAKLLEPVSLGSVYPSLEVLRIDVVREEHSLDVTFLPGWAVAILQVAINYRSRPGSP
jgi:hypothetical protein